MIRATSWIICTISIIAASSFVTTLRADDKSQTKLALHPSTEPIPALKYRLLPAATDQISGNAAVPYGKITAEQWVFFPKYANTDVITSWQEMPLEKLRSENIPIPTPQCFSLNKVRSASVATGNCR